MKLALSFVGAIAVIALAACSGSRRQEAVADCVFPENPTQKAPAWVCPPHAVQGSRDTGLGVHPKSGAGYQFSFDQASVKARLSLAAQLRTRVSGLIRAHADSVGAGAGEVVDQVAKSTSEQITEETLVGAKVVRSTVDAKGNVYALVGMDLESSRRLAQEAVQRSMQKEPAAWRPLQRDRNAAQVQLDILKSDEGS